MKKTIRLCYRKIIDATATTAWDKLVFDSSYTEFLMQSQLYNPDKRLTGFAEMINNDSRAEQLHFLVSTSVTGYLQQLNGVVPDILNNQGRHFLTFKQFRFEIINSNIKNKQLHQVAINFFSDPMIWHNTIDNYLLLSATGSKLNDEEVLTHLLQLKPFLSIYSIKESVG